MIKVGEFIRTVRKRRRLTTTQLAEKLELSNGYISLIERDIVSPSLATLRNIANVLQVPLESFFLNMEEEVVYSHLKQEEQEVLTNKGKNWRMLIDKNRTNIMGAYFADVPEQDEDIYSHEGVKLIYVLEGESAISIAKEDYTLKAGDSLYFDASLLHWDQKDNDNPRKVLVVTVPAEDFHF
mgnify:CR=1 FL=1